MAMIEKKNYILRHIILILVVIIVLFPLVWVVSTSLRRDNGAFSPNLFSSRLTLRNYSDLLFPTLNSPEVIKEMNGVTAYIDSYAKYTPEQSKQKMLELTGKLDAYMNGTVVALNEIEEIYKEIMKLNLENSENLKKDINNIRISDSEYFSKKLSEITDSSKKSGLSIDLSKFESIVNAHIKAQKDAFETAKKYNDGSAYYNETVRMIYNITSIVAKDWNSSVYTNWSAVNPKVSELVPLIENLDKMNAELAQAIVDIGQLIINEKNAKLKETMLAIAKYDVDMKKSQFQSLTDEQKKLSEDLQALYNKLTAIVDMYIPEKDRIQSSFNTIKKLDLSNVSETSPDSPEAQNVKSLIERFNEVMPQVHEQIKDVEILQTKGLTDTIKVFVDSYSFISSNFNKIYTLKDTERVSAAYNAVSSSTLKMASTIDEVLSIASNYKEAVKKSAELEKTILDSKKEIETLEKEGKEYRAQNKEKIALVESLDELPYVLIYSKYLKELPIDSFAQTSVYLANLDTATKKIPSYKFEAKKYFIFDLDAKIKESYSRYKNGKKKMFALIDSFREQNNILKSDLSDIVKINAGSFVSSIMPVDKMTETYDTKYDDARADVSRAARIVSDLADNTPYTNINAKMRDIDYRLYNINKDWEKRVSKPFLRWMINSIVVAAITSILTVIMTALAAYPFSRMRFKGRDQGLFVLMILQMFPAVMSMVALYGILSFVGNYIPGIGLDSIGGLIFAYMGGIAYNMWLFKGYYDTIPDSFEESAMIDGATRFQTFWKIVFPLCLPIIAVVSILTFMGQFNEFVLARVILQSEENFTYAVGLQSFTAANGPFSTEWGLFTAAALIGAVPMVIIFLSMQKWIVGGLTQGGVKG